MAREHSDSSLLSWRERFRLLPPSVRAFVLVLLLCAILPGVLVVHGVFYDSAAAVPLGLLARRPWLTAAASFPVALGGLLALERPRSWSLRDYASQLGARFQQVQADFDGALRRRAQEEEARHGPRPSP